MKEKTVIGSIVAGGMVCCGCAFADQQTGNTPPAPDYSTDRAWLAKADRLDKPVDVFYVYPTIYAGLDPKNMDISDPALRANAAGLLKAQAAVYSGHANLFAPFYRQQSGATQSMKAGNDGNDPFLDPAFQLGAGDVERAFDYYIKNLNPDRPFIIAGHSQGSMALINLMRKRFNDEALQKRLVAAYLIGYSVPVNELDEYFWMKPAQGEADTGVIISYNTEGPDAGPSPVLYPGQVILINPLNWNTDATPAGPQANLGAKFFNDATGELIEEIPNFTGAHIDTDKSVLIVDDMKTPKSDKIDLVNLGRWSDRVYHRFDYAFFFNNLTENVRKRIDAYLAKGKSDAKQ
jgi:hypothetical protein